MSIRRSIGIVVGLGLIWTLMMSPVSAQTTGGGTTGGGLGGGSTGGGGGGSSGSAAAGVGTAAPVAITTKGPTSGAGSTTSIPSNSNPFAPTYVDALALGLPKLYANTTGSNPPKITSSTFGKPLYGNVATTTGGAGVSATTTAIGFTTIGIVRSPSYITSLSDEIPFKIHSAPALQADARAVIDQSSFINNKENIDVAVEGGIAVLRGQVGTEKERRIAENMLRTTPGIRDVQNQLQIIPVVVGQR